MLHIIKVILGVFCWLFPSIRDIVVYKSKATSLLFQMNQTEKTIAGTLSKAFACHLGDIVNRETTTREFNCPGNTHIRLDDGLIFISLYNTTIAIISIKERWIELNTKNYISEKIFRTNTTKSRLNMLLEICVPEARIYQKGYRWFVGLPSSDIPFVDGYRLPLPKELYYGVAS